MEYKNLTFIIENNIAIITINRPDKMNALNFEVLDELYIATKEIYDNTEIIGAIVTGSGEKSFVAGADIHEIAALNELNGRKAAEKGQELFAYIENAPKLIIAAVNGYALGGGCELAMACHIRVAAEHAQFAQPEINIGIVPGYGGTQRMAQMIGKSKTIELMLTGDRLSAQEAYQMRLVSYVVPMAELINKCKEIINKIREKPALSIELIISCVNSAFNKDDDGYKAEANAFANCLATDDFKEGTTAFMEKRKPRFSGR
ncbi:MAG: enoyl-CoA hydratase-related protein [Cytophagales bacterium]|nr:enoyl-CoA hydratase-related protein [Cytophagales bacterium]